MAKKSILEKETESVKKQLQKASADDSDVKVENTQESDTVSTDDGVDEEPLASKKPIKPKGGAGGGLLTDKILDALKK